MFDSRTALLVVDAQESFRHRPYWNNDDAPEFIGRLQELIDGARAGGILWCRSSTWRTKEFSRLHRDM
jgi:nicotinamidase-related amidase